MPNLTTKELSYLKDQLTSEQNEVAQFNLLAQQCEDPQLKSKLAGIASRHQNHYDTLYRFLAN
ncbi:MAG: spore coat protein [Clostridiaceae bacterium]|jgi:hypothetical protein|nr:spore coat protein [Clostridiaceae bacterium]MCI9510831.1 spore coat protein [Oscillibacter sp.]